MGKPRSKRTTAADGTVSVIAKNANGQGSVYRAKVKRGGVETLRWEAAETLPGGGRIKRTGATQAEAVDRLARAIEERTVMAGAGRLGPNPTVADLVEYYLDNFATPGVAPTTADTYRKMGVVVVRISGACLVREFDLDAAQDLVNKLGDAYSIHFARGSRRIARQAFNRAIGLGYLASNPFDQIERVSTPKDRVKRRTLTLDEHRALIAEAIRFGPPEDGEAEAPLYRHGLAVAFLFAMGLRVSEVLGLKWEDFDYEAGRVAIERAVVYRDRVGPVVGPTKTVATEGIRLLPGYLHEPLRMLRAFQVEERRALGPDCEPRGDGFVFVGTRHQLVNRQAVTKELHRVCDALGIGTSGLGTHSGRRTYITNSYRDGAHTEDIAGAVGHAHPSTTLRYVQSLGDRPSATAQRMADLLAPEPVPGELP